MKPIAIIYTCRNPGQVALMWTWQPPPFGHGWIDVKAEPLVRLSEVEARLADLAASCVQAAEMCDEDVRGRRFAATFDVLANKLRGITA